MIQPSLYIDISAGKGRGVFTSELIPAGTTIEVAPVIVMKQSDREHLDKTLLHDYIFVWGKKQDHCCMALGWVPIYNHAYQSNCEYFMDFDDESIMIEAVKDIQAGEELTINYNGDSADQAKVWFDTAINTNDGGR